MNRRPKKDNGTVFSDAQIEVLRHQHGRKVPDVTETLSERGKIYGDYSKQAETAQAIKLAIHCTPNWGSMSGAQRESMDLMATKLSRILHGDANYKDSWLDLEGYAHLVILTLAP